MTIAAPGGDQPVWAFASTTPKGHATVTLAYSRKMPSRLILPVVPGVTVPTAAAALPGPARRALPHYQPLANRGT